MNNTHNPALAALRHHVTGAVERGEATAIVEVPAGNPWHGAHSLGVRAGCDCPDCRPSHN